MKKAILILCVLFIFFVSACTVLIHHVNIDSYVTFNKRNQEKIPIKVGLYLIKKDLTKMPYAKEDKDLWSWYFVEGLKTVFTEVVIIEELGEKKLSSDIALIIKPELSTFGMFQRSQHDATQDYILGFKFCFLNKYGVEQFSFIVEEKSTTATGHIPFIGRGDYYNPILAQAMDEVMKKFQNIVYQRREKIVTIAQK